LIPQVVYKQDNEFFCEKIVADTKKSLFSIQDVNLKIKETDNYIQKYLPIRVQEMINEAFKTLAKDDQDKEKVLRYEIQKYKDFHKIVAGDTGESTLQKTVSPEVSLPKLEKELTELKKKNIIRQDVAKHSINTPDLAKVEDDK